MEAILNKDDYREFTQRVDIAVSKGEEVPHIVEMISANQFKVTLLKKLDLELLDNITKDVKPQRIFP
tara:strand:+ start:1549 stop:1749 length:201 start_codon:yes stop_codon:yes gene_type:complete